MGGHKRLRPAAFAKELSAFDLVNIGAAGTFIVRKTVSQTTLRAELLRRLPFSAELMICRAHDLLDLMSGDYFRLEGSLKGVRRFVSILAEPPRSLPQCPFSQPEGRAWQVKVVGLRGRFVMSLWRRTGKTMIYPNEVVEKKLGIPATTRSWDTISKIHDVLREKLRE